MRVALALRIYTEFCLGGPYVCAIKKRRFHLNENGYLKKLKGDEEYYVLCRA